MSDLNPIDLWKFEQLALPYASKSISGWTGWKSIQSAKQEELKLFDIFGGCDILFHGGTSFGVAVRVNNQLWETFTIGFIEFNKRMAAIRRRLNSPNSFPVFPEYTMQAVIVDGYQSCAVVRTWDLYKAITNNFTSDLPMIQLKQGAKPFWCIEWDRLRDLGVPVWVHYKDGRILGEQFQ